MRDVKRGAPQAKVVLKLVPAATAIAAQLKLPRLEGETDRFGRNADLKGRPREGPSPRHSRYSIARMKQP